MTGETLVRSLPATAENVTSLRHAVSALARAAGSGPERVGDVALAVGEACGNVVLHAYPPGETGPLIVEAVAEDRDLCVVVADQGRGMAPRPDSAGLGLGLPLMASLCDELHVEGGTDGVGTTVTMRFAIA